MSINNQPTNFNFLSPVGYKLVLSRVPNIEYFVQNIALPSIQLPPAVQPTPFVTIPRPGDRLQYGSVEFSFKVNENLDNYLEIYNWMVALGRPESFNQYTLKDRPFLSTDEQKDTTTSDISVIILSSSMNPNYEFRMRDCFPTSLTNIDLSSTVSDIEYVTATATFAIRDFIVEQI